MSWLSDFGKALDFTDDDSWVRETMSDFDPSRAGGLANWMTFGGAKAVGLDHRLNDMQARAGLGGTTEAQRKAKAAEEEQKKKQADAATESAKWAEEYGKWREGWSHVGDIYDENGALTRTGRRADELGDIYTGEIDRGMYDASTRTAALMARRGLNDSGYAAGGQTDVISQAAAGRALARERAMSESINENMQILNGDLLALGGQAGVAMEPYRAARDWSQQQQLLQQQQAWQDEQEQMQFLSSLAMLGFLL